jgi:anthranilate synthase component 1
VSTDGTVSYPVPFGPQDLRRLAYGNPSSYPVLFDSAAAGPLGRYSILAAYPEAALWQDSGGRLQHWGLERPVDAGQGFLHVLEQLWREQQTGPDPTAARGTEPSSPFRGGWIVYLGYELAAEIEPQLALPTAPTAQLAPRAFALRVPAALVYDHETGRSLAVVELGREALRERLAEALGDWSPQPDCASTPSDVGLGGLRLEEEDPERFGSCVDAALEHIRAGDIYQANLSRGWRASWNPAPGPQALGEASARLYERLRTQNPAPFAALAQFQGWYLLSSSPERLVRVAGRHVETRPIAGTRPRSRSAEADSEELAALIAHPKERAEHIMLVDLERNDLGRICRAGTVRADELMRTESYAHVHHIVSNVCGELNDGLSPIDVLRAVFPGGSITGCPKFRCMQIIAALERSARGAYTGALGYINRDGAMDFNILIRTITMDAQALEFRAGAGIVADSDRQLELQETRAKARGMIAALQHC